jgi:hypothetical protein
MLDISFGGAMLLLIKDAVSDSVGIKSGGRVLVAQSKPGLRNKEEGNMDMQLIAVAGLVAVTITLWATRGLPEYLTALLFFAFAMILHVAPASLVFSGFTSAFWLVISGYVVGCHSQDGFGLSMCGGSRLIFPDRMRKWSLVLSASRTCLPLLCLPTWGVLHF